MKVRALLPLYPPLRMDSESYARFYNRLISHFQNPTEIKVCGTDLHDGSTLVVQIERCTSRLKRKYFSKVLILEMSEWMLEFSGEFEFPGSDVYFLTDHAGAKISSSEQELRELWERFLPDLLDVTIQTYISSLLLAFSGAVRPIDYVWLNDDKSTKRSCYVSIVHESIEFLVENGLLPREDLECETSARWVFSQNGMFRGYSDTPASRAMNFFTRLLRHRFHDDELSDLVWALAGIESLLVQGGRSSLGQLTEKLAAIFDGRANPIWMREMTRKMYDFRSRMIHGDRQIRSSFRDDDEDGKSHEKRFHEEYDSARFAVGILALLLQEMIVRNLSKLRFQTIISE